MFINKFASTPNEANQRTHLAENGPVRGCAWIIHSLLDVETDAAFSGHVNLRHTATQRREVTDPRGCSTLVSKRRQITHTAVILTLFAKAAAVEDGGHSHAHEEQNLASSAGHSSPAAATATTVKVTQNKAATQTTPPQ